MMPLQQQNFQNKILYIETELDQKPVPLNPDLEHPASHQENTQLLYDAVYLPQAEDENNSSLSQAPHLEDHISQIHNCTDLRLWLLRKQMLEKIEKIDRLAKTTWHF